jgi:hypothetical protein
MTDLKDTNLIYLKAILFLAMLITSAAMLIYEPCAFKRAILVPILIWSSARLYYFMFYVIEKYVDPSYRFSGIFSFLKYLLRTPRNH